MRGAADGATRDVVAADGGAAREAATVDVVAATADVRIDVEDVGTGDAGTGNPRDGQTPDGAQKEGGDGSVEAGSPAFDRAAVSSIMRLVDSYAIASFGTGNDDGWSRAVYHAGNLSAYRALGDATFNAYSMQWGQANDWQLHADANGPRYADNQTCAQSYAELFLENPTAPNDVMIAAAETTFDAMVLSPKPGRVEWSWCDALFMAPAAMARVAEASGKSQYVTLMDNMFWDTEAYLYDPTESLFWRDGSFVGTNTYWSRGNGWVAAGIARILEVLPTTDGRHADYETLLSEMAAKLRTLQASDGFWRSSLTQPNAYTTPESSGTALFCYAMAWGINNGVLDRATYLPTVSGAWAALGTAVNAQGRLGWVQGVGSQPGPSTVDSTEDYAVGAFLLAGSEILKL
jgi:rhamnogalacturonyl hydrolase YesR